MDNETEVNAVGSELARAHRGARGRARRVEPRRCRGGRYRGLSEGDDIGSEMLGLKVRYVVAGSSERVGDTVGTAKEGENDGELVGDAVVGSMWETS